MRPPFAASLGALKASVFADLAPAIQRRKAAGLALAPLHIGDTYREPAATLSMLPAWATTQASYAYGALGGVPALRESLAERFTRERGVPTQASEILVTVGATHGLLCTARACVDAGAEVVVLAPYWPLSVGVLRSAGAVPVEVAFTDVLHREGVDGALAAVRSALTARTKALYFASPNNPCGTVYAPEVLRALVALAEEHDLWVFVDEVYADYSYDTAFMSAASFGLERVVVVVSLSKSHGLAGARIGFVRATPGVLEHVGKVATHSAFHPSIHAQGLAFAAIASETWIRNAHVEYTEARAVVVRSLEEARVLFLPPSGGSYVFADFGTFAPGGPGTSVQPLFERFIDAGVLVCPGAACGDAYTTYARICFTAEPAEALKASMGRMVGALRG